MDQRSWHTRKNWTTDEVKRLRFLAGSLCLAEIAEQMGRSENSIRGASQRYGIKVATNHYSERKHALNMRILELYKTKPISQICKITGLTYNKVYGIVTKNPG